MCEDKECVCCKNGIEAVLKWEQEMMEKHGWYIHYVPGDTDCPNDFNCHTHGISETFKRPDFQIVVPLEQGICASIFRRLVEKIQAGDAIEGLMDDVIGLYSVRVVPATEGDREVMRVVLPDKDGNLDNFTDEEFAAQLL